MTGISIKYRILPSARETYLHSKRIITMTIISNYQPRPLLSGLDLTDNEREEFDYMEDIEGNNGFFRYKGDVYNLDMFINWNHPYWNGCHNLNFWSGICIKVNSATDSVIVGLYHS